MTYDSVMLEGVLPEDAYSVDTIQSWSFSSLQVYEECAYRSKLARVDKIPEPVRETPPAGMTEWPHERGTRVHDNAEMYVRGEVIEPCSELKHFIPELNHLKTLYEANMVEMEEMWCYNIDWECVDEERIEDIWLRVKLDAAVFTGDNRAVVVDYKTGKKAGNEVKHAEQGQLYAVGTFMRFPEIEQVDVEFWYIDHDMLTQQTYTRTAGLMFWKRFNERGLRMTSDNEFDANPNKWSCRFCPYNKPENANKWVTGNGACQFGV